MSNSEEYFDMVLKRDNQYLFQCVLFVCALIGIFIIFVFGMKMNIYVALFLNLPQSIIVALYAISYGRTFVFDKNGCTVCFLRYRKFYSWQELKTKKIEEYEMRSMFDRHVCSYPKSAMFAPYKVHKPKAMRPWHYTLIHPLSFVYVNFSFETQYHNGRHYEISEEEFWQKMKEWGIEISSTD